MTADDLGGGGGDSANSVASKVDDLEIDDLTLAEAKESARGGRHRVDPRPASAHRRKEGRKIMVPPSTAPPGHDDITTAAAKAAPFDKNDDQKRDDSGNYGMSGALPESTQSRARALARQREIQMRKRQQSMQSAAMMRGASGMLPNGQFTPGVAQFSAPRAVDDDPYGPFGDRGDAWRPALASASMAGPHAARDPENYGATHLADARATTQRLRQPAESRPQTASSVYSDDPQRYDRQLTSRSPPTRDTPDADYRSPQSLRSSGHSPYRAHPEERWSSSDYRRESDARQQQPPPQRGPDDEYYRRQRSDRDGAESDWQRRSDEEPSREPTRSNRDDDDYEPPPRPEEREAADGAAAAKSKAEPPPPEFDITALPLHNMRKFLTEPCPRAAGIVQCYIKRNRSGTNKLFPEYTVYMKEGDRFLMCSKKRPNNKTSNYLISMGENDLKRNSPNYIGKLRANFAGTEFQIFDAGWNPKSFEPDLEDEGAQMRNELGAVIYTSNVLGSRGPRKMQVAIPKIEDVVVKDDAKPSQQPARGVTDILTKMKAHDYASLIYMINKPPRWNEQVGAYVLNFNGRVTMASVKNFQLVQPEEQESIFLQFGRVGKDEFTMDFQWPMTPFAAFAITLSSFDSKIACE
ncbi:hypothetical protein CTAYLR_000991 [Chrysophaeum taylorii]|uniref:Tubby C-terminal domain-containing protein n=1 Tax=Chrysophaeum taylorii TaxID=2483200 RepID=A0AAD7UFZ7_9STRA|nr:hypothetical protein CTAYLR_000991 [Chrysophaeum taylorii]